MAKRAWNNGKTFAGQQASVNLATCRSVACVDLSYFYTNIVPKADSNFVHLAFIYMNVMSESVLFEDTYLI